MQQLGDYLEDATVDFKWPTSDGSGGSITRATDGTVSVYKGNNVTQSVAGVTDTEDFDSTTGVHHCRINLSADAFYAIGNDYQVVLTGATIDGETVNAVLAHFSIENRFQEVDVVKWLGQACVAVGVNGVPVVDMTHIHGTGLTETAGQLAGRFTDYFDQASAAFHVATALASFKATGFSTHDAAAVKTAIEAGGSSIAGIKAVTDNHPDSGAFTTIGTDTARLTAVRAAVLTDWIDDGRLDALLDLVSTHDAAAVVTALGDVYYADVYLTVDEANTQDEYTVQWYKNGAPVTSGITVPKIQVVARATGNDLIALTAMTQIGSTGAYKYDEATNRLTAGESAVAYVTATIDGSGRTWRRVVGRDSTA